MKLYRLLLLVGTLCARGIDGLQCHEGFNTSVSGIPLYHWSEKACKDNSDCFMQEVMVQIPRTDLEVGMRYGGCVTKSYSPSLTCEKLFGGASDLDPTVLLNMLPSMDDKLHAFSEDMNENITESLRTLFSNGTGTESFITGCYTFLENLGFNMEKALPLKDKFVNLMNLALQPPGYIKPYEDRNWPDVPQVDPIVKEFMTALGGLGASDMDVASQIYSFLGNFMTQQTIQDLQDSDFLPLATHLPGLIKSVLPTYLSVDAWYETAYKLLGDLNIHQPKQSIVNITNTIKANVKIPDEYSHYLNPILNSAPDLVENLVIGNYGNVLHWAAVLLSHESTVTADTKKLSGALNKLYVSWFGQTPTGDIDLLITWLPGIYYKLFTGEETELGKIYSTLAEEIESIDFSKPNITAKKSNMSEFVHFILQKTVFTQPQFSPLYPRINLLVINLSRATYTLFSDRKHEIDIIFTTLQEGFRDWPVFDLGDVLELVIIKLGYAIPRLVEPLVDNLQDLIMTPVNNASMQRAVYLKVAQNVVESYESLYPKSEYPGIAMSVVQYFNLSYHGPEYYYCYYRMYDSEDVYAECQAKQYKAYDDFSRQLYSYLIDINVDLSFALADEINTRDGTIYHEILNAFPDFSFYIRLMRILGREDIKQLYKDYYLWITVMINHERDVGFFESLAWAFNGTVSKITSKVGSSLGELRGRFAPRSCVYNACSLSLCNTHMKISSLVQMQNARDSTKSKEGKEEHLSIDRNLGDASNTTGVTTTAVPSTTTSYSIRVQASYFLNVVVMTIMLKYV